MSLVAILKAFMLKFGYLATFSSVFLEYLCFPIPSEVILPFAGDLAISNGQNIYILTLFSVIGGNLGALVVFLIGRFVDKNYSDKLFKIFPKFKDPIEKSKSFLYKHRYIGVFLSRLSPVGRTTSSIVAGMVGMKVPKFLICSVLGMTIWNFTLIKLGSLFYKDEKTLLLIIHKYSLVFIFLVIILVIFLVIHFIKNKKSSK
ncbi:MAG: DedA family protein [Clostridium chrysemydis]|uniref:DedA family protein n=2 Tax=Clostridium chrysemydis TaxID=2665504 RepID=UPI003F33EDDC